MRLAVVVVVVSACGSAADTEAHGLDDYVVGGGFIDQREQLEIEARRDIDVESAIAACMEEEGFDYVARPVAVPVSPPSDEEIEAFRRSYGFGVAAGVLGVGPPGPGSSAPTTGDEAAEDPNVAVVASLPGPSAVEYVRVLTGADLGEAEVADLDLAALRATATPGSCAFEARRSVAVSEGSEGFWQEFATEWNALVDRALADPRIVELRRSWQRCMSDAGFDVSDQGELLVTVVDRVDDLVELQTTSVRALYDQGRRSIPAGEEPSFDRRALEAAMAEEAEAALADLECSRGDDEVRAEVFAEYEERFVEDHYERLQAWRLEGR